MSDTKLCCIFRPSHRRFLLPQLTARETKTEVARFSYDVVHPGSSSLSLHNQHYIEVGSTTLDLDMIIITFVITEKRRREREAHPDGDETPFENGFEGAATA